MGVRRPLRPGERDDPELRPLVEAYARDEARFCRDCADAYRRLTWFGGDDPAARDGP